MKRSNAMLILSFIGVALTVLVMITATYAYFTIDVEGTGENITTDAYDKDLKINYTDTSNFALVNAYTGDYISKTFEVENDSEIAIYYNILFTELVNNYVNPKDLVYTITSNDGGINKEQTVAPTTNNSLIGSYIKIDAGQTHTYTLTISFLKTTEDQSDNMNKTFSTKVDIEGVSELSNTYTLYRTKDLGYSILNSNTVLSESDLNFNEVPLASGLYYTNNTIEGATVYYFRGNNSLNNNVLFAGYCWKIIRTTEDLGIRIIFNGTPSGGSCENPTTTNAFTSAFNANDSYNAYVGFKYGSPNSLTYSSEHANTNSSTIKGLLDTWYTEHLNDYSSYIEDSLYCNNRETAAFESSNILYTNRGFANNNTGYESYHRINILNNRPLLYCNNEDLFSINNTKGNLNGSTNPIGLLTIDEAVLAGYAVGLSSTSNYLNNNSSYWTMTPAYYYSNHAYNYYISSGVMNTDEVTTTVHGVRPVITLKDSTEILSGNGSLSSPYRITN